MKETISELRRLYAAAAQGEWYADVSDPADCVLWCGDKFLANVGSDRERRPDGNDTCLSGHVYPSREAITTRVSTDELYKEFSSWWQQTMKKCGSAFVREVIFNSKKSLWSEWQSAHKKFYESN